jgi:hypothetical protein
LDIERTGNLVSLGTERLKYTWSFMEEMTTVKDWFSRRPSSREMAFKAVKSVEWYVELNSRDSG